jgi:hypothetical protein
VTWCRIQAIHGNIIIIIIIIIIIMILTSACPAGSVLVVPTGMGRVLEPRARSWRETIESAGKRRRRTS